MDWATVIIIGAAIYTGVIAYRKRDGSYEKGIEIAKAQAWVTLPKIIFAIFISGFFAQIVPTELVALWLGKESGLKGILIGSVAGGLTPGGPIICFPIVYVLFKTGASIPALVSFLAAWSIFAFHRVLAYELPLLGFRFVSIRFASCLILPPLSGVVAQAIMSIFKIEIT